MSFAYGFKLVVMWNWKIFNNQVVLFLECQLCTLDQLGRIFTRLLHLGNQIHQSLSRTSLQQNFCILTKRMFVFVVVVDSGLSFGGSILVLLLGSVTHLRGFASPPVKHVFSQCQLFALCRAYALNTHTHTHTCILKERKKEKRSLGHYQ